jgi:hypothetical protein
LRAAWPFEFLLVPKLTRLESLLLAVLSTIAKMRFRLDFDTPSWDANSVADFTGNESVRAFDMNSNLSRKGENYKQRLRSSLTR